MNDREVVDALHKLELSIAERMHTHTLALELNNQKLEGLAMQMEKQHNAIFGTHYEEDPGLLVQMGQIKKTEQERKYTLRTVLVSFLALCSKFVYDFFSTI